MLNLAEIPAKLHQRHCDAMTLFRQILGISLIPLFFLFFYSLNAPKDLNPLLVMGTIFSLTGILIYFHCAENVNKLRSLRDWPIARGKVTSAQIQTLRRGNAVSHRPVIHFEYTMEDHAYTGDSLSPVGYSGSLKHAREVLNRFPEGESVDVFINPDDNSEAYLDPELHVGQLLTSIVLPIAATLLGIALIAYGFTMPLPF